MAFESVARTHVGCRRRLNEDALLSRPDLGLWAVADGVGGHQAGEVASGLVVERLAACDGEGDVLLRAAAVQQALAGVNAELLAMSAAAGAQRTISTTVVAMVADATSFACLWAGDSRAYRVRGGELTQLTRDHSLVQELVDAGELDPADAANHPNSNIITRAVGGSARFEIEVIGGDVRPADAFLLASDGLTRLVGDEELLSSLTADDLEAAADSLIDTCLARGAPDNVTFVIVRPR